MSLSWPTLYEKVECTCNYVILLSLREGVVNVNSLYSHKEAMLKIYE
jgi:hypothetical protein